MRAVSSVKDWYVFLRIHPIAYHAGLIFRVLAKIAAFNLLDKERKGYIVIEEFGGLMRHFDKKASAVQVRIMFDALDLEHDGRVDIYEFFAIDRLSVSSASLAWSSGYRQH